MISTGEKGTEFLLQSLWQCHAHLQQCMCLNEVIPTQSQPSRRLKIFLNWTDLDILQETEKQQLSPQVSIKISVCYHNHAAMHTHTCVERDSKKILWDMSQICPIILHELYAIMWPTARLFNWWPRYFHLATTSHIAPTAAMARASGTGHGGREPTWGMDCLHSQGPTGCVIMAGQKLDNPDSVQTWSPS